MKKYTPAGTLTLVRGPLPIEGKLRSWHFVSRGTTYDKPPFWWRAKVALALLFGRYRPVKTLNFQLETGQNL